MLIPVAVQGQLIPLYDQIPEPQDYPPCELPPAQPFADVGSPLENLHFLNGSMYVTGFSNGLYRITPDAVVHHVMQEQSASLSPFAQPKSMMGVTDFDGALFVSQGSSVGQPTEARILRFASPGQPDYTVFADGFDGANGLTSDAAGNLYLAHGFGRGIWKVAPDGSYDHWLDLPMANGVDLMPDGQRLVVAHVTDAGSTALAVALADPADRVPLFVFNALDENRPASSDASKPLLTKLIDDLTVTTDGRVLATAHERLQTMLGDPHTGKACILMEHDASPTSVRVASQFSPWNGKAFVTDLTGTVWMIDLGVPMPDVPVEASQAVAQEAPGAGVVVLLCMMVLLASRRR